MALGDAVTLGLAVRQHKNDLRAAFNPYQLVRNSLWQGRTQPAFHDARQWLCGWNPENCMSRIRL